MLGLDDSAILRLNDQYVLYKLNLDESLSWLFDIEEGSYFDLNNVSFFIFSQFDGNRSVDEARKLTLAEYPDEDRGKVISDFDTLIEKSVNEGILTKGGN